MSSTLCDKKGIHAIYKIVQEKLQNFWSKYTLVLYLTMELSNKDFSNFVVE